MIDEELYKLATRELNSKNRRPELWARAVALASDDHDEARYLYINLRVEELSEAGNTGSPQDLSQEIPDTLSFDTKTINVETSDSEPDLIAYGEKAQTLKFGQDQPATSFSTRDELDITNRVPKADQSARDSSGHDKIPVYGAATQAESKEKLQMAPDGELSLQEDIPRIEPDNDNPVEHASNITDKERPGPESDPISDHSEQVEVKLNSTSSIGDIAELEPTSAIESGDIETGDPESGTIEAEEWRNSRAAAEYLEAHPEPTLDIDQTIRVDQPTSLYLEADDADHRPLDITTNHTLNPGEINDGNVNPEIDLDRHANQSASEVEDVIPGYGGSRFYSVFNHRDGRTRAVKLGGSWPATFFTLPWLLYKNLWGTAFVYLILLIIFLATFVIFGFHFLDAGAVPIQTKLAAAGFCILGFLGLFYIPYKYGNSWVTEKLERKGFSFNTALAAGSADEARQRVR